MKRLDLLVVAALAALVLGLWAFQATTPIRGPDVALTTVTDNAAETAAFTAPTAAIENTAVLTGATIENLAKNSATGLEDGVRTGDVAMTTISVLLFYTGAAIVFTVSGRLQRAMTSILSSDPKARHRRRFRLFGDTSEANRRKMRIRLGRWPAGDRRLVAAA